MLSKGYVAASIDEICGAAGVTKGSFFHHFACKEELGKVLLLHFGHKQLAAMQGAISTLEDPLDRVYALLDVCADRCRDATMRGCLIGTFAQEISETHPILRDVCGACFRHLAAAVATDLTLAQARHAPRLDVDPAGLADCLVALIQGSLLLQRATTDVEVMGRNLRHFKNLLKTSFGR